MKVNKNHSEGKQILILGIGNILLQDEGIGPESIKYLKKQPLPNYVALLDGGTGGFHLLSFITDYSHIIIIDAILDNNPAGTIKIIEPLHAKNFPQSLSAHELGLKDLIDAAILLDKLPKIYLLAVSIKDFQQLGKGLSPKINNLFSDIYKYVSNILENIEKDKY